MRRHCPLEVPFSTGHRWTRRCPDWTLSSGCLRGNSPFCLLVWLCYSSCRIASRGSETFLICPVTGPNLLAKHPKWESTFMSCVIISYQPFSPCIKIKATQSLQLFFSHNGASIWLSFQSCIYPCQCQGINGSSWMDGTRGVHLLVGAQICSGQKGWFNHKLT